MRLLATDDNMEEVLMNLGQSKLMAVDTETTGLNVSDGTHHLIGMSMSTEHGFHTYIPLQHTEGNVDMKWVDRIREVLSTPDLIWHHRKFDMHSFKTIGIDPLEFKGIQYDAMLLFHMWYEEFYSFTMDALAKTFIKHKGKLRSEEIHHIGKMYGYDSVPVGLMGDYAMMDTDITLQLWQFIWPKIIEENLDKVYLETEMPFTRLLYKMEQRGVGVREDFVKRKVEIGRGRMETLHRLLRFNPASTKDLKEVFIDILGLPILKTTKTGKPSFTKDVMEQYDEMLMYFTDEKTKDLARRITEYRGWQKAVTSLYEPLLSKKSPDGYIRTNFKQHGTITGRLSASNPNLQQIPRSSNNFWNGDAKSSFFSGREGYTLIGWDYSQLELRLAAAYGNETSLISEFEKPDADPFRVLAITMFKFFSNENRQTAKTFTYASQYGAGVETISKQINKDTAETKVLFDSYKESTPGITKVSRDVNAIMKNRGYITYWDGRRRHMKNKSDSFKAWNSLCQGGGSQLVKKAMLKIEPYETEDFYMVLQVHDEIVFIIKDELIEHYRPIIEKEMTDFDIGVTLAVDSKEWQ